ncbi:glycogen-binding subunit 76A isoform X2 [Leguminivora glycinivorella]|uniref:glycogen-binding subunit 76A isoform X2 n=1 Tax=Leguminivora glycinivorella TaxID=1035111 RepID=UPI00200E9F79|nr:glycogen-binding subunit 76A isoform X2 [Leguminivora glycinivorella]
MTGQEMDMRSQMNGEHGGSQCGLTSLLPMSCRGRAAAFARDLHSRLRNLGAHDADESSWLAKENGAPLRHPNPAQRDLDTFYDFELECESPSSPVDEFCPPLNDRSPTDDEPPFYDVDGEPEPAEQTKLIPEKKRNGFKFSTAFYSEGSPVKVQPVARENGTADKKLFSPITFEGCARHNSYDEIDCVVRPSTLETDRLSLPTFNSTTIDSDSEFESAKSEPSECVDEVFSNEKRPTNDVSAVLETLSLTEVEPIEEEAVVEQNEEIKENHINVESNETLEIVTSEVADDKELSPAPEIEPSLLNAETIDEEEHEETDDRPQRVRRCSSLKTGKTPPGTPGRKKIVRFADVLGLDLADVKTFMDEIPVIPKSAYDDLTGCDVASSPPARPPPRLGALTLVPLFVLPRDVTDKLEIQNVCLESARVCDGVHVTICGSVRVRNLDFNKTVHVRYTMNKWKTYTDLQANYVQGSCDGFSDRFQFVLYAPCILSGQRLELAVRFQCKGQQFWDNNCGANYCFDCLALGALAPAAPSSPPHSTPLHPQVEWHPSFY